MSKFTTLLCLIPSLSFSSTYYLSNSGNDSSSGTSSATAWQTTARLNMVTFNPGDSVLFNSGDVFRGSVNVHQSGNAASPIVFTSYGAGAKPVISGAEVVTTWTPSGNIYSTPVTTVVRNFFVNDREMIVARYPNEHSYLTLDSATQTNIYDAQLNVPQITNWNNTRVCIHTCQWAWEKSSITNYVTGQLTISPTQVVSANGYGYFIYNSLDILDTALEYYNDTTAHMLYYQPPSGQDPNTENCEISVLNVGIRLFSNVSYIKINNISFVEQIQAGVLMTDSSSNHVTVDHCNFLRQYNFGVQVRGNNNQVSNCFFTGVDGHGVDVGNGFSNEIHHNVFKRIGQYRNSGIGGQTNCIAIAIYSSDSNYIHHNDIDTTGYCGISCDGPYSLIERNYASHCMTLNNDGAPYKSWGPTAHDIIFRNNFATESNGNNEGTANGNFKTPGFYYDIGANHILVQDNTIFNQDPAGILLNSGTNNIMVEGNVVYGTEFGIDFNGGQQFGAAPSFGHSAIHNTCFALLPQSVCMKQVDYTFNWNWGVVDSNYYWQPYDSTHTALRVNNGNQPIFYTLSQWQDSTGEDLNTRKNFEDWTYPANNSQLFYNVSDTVATFSLGANEYLDLDSNIVCGSLQLQPFTSKVLITTTNACATGINEASSGQNNLRVFPNPFSEDITIQIPGNWKGAVEIGIYNAIGQFLQSTQLTSDHKLDLSNFNVGIYFLKASCNDSILYTRIIKNL